MSRHYELYFIANKRRSCVKIGVSSNVAARLHDLQAGNHEQLHLALRLSFAEPKAALAYEDALHQHFAAHWLHREWFRFDRSIKDYVEAWLANQSPTIPWPLTSCAAFVDEHGARLPKAELMALLRKQARRK